MEANQTAAQVAATTTTQPVGKKITLNVIAIQTNADGTGVILTKPSAQNPSPTGVYRMSQGQLNRIAQRVLGFPGVIQLKYGIASSNGSAKMTVEAITHKAGDTWTNPVTGETGTYGDKNGGKDWTEFRNHEIELGLAASSNMFSESLKIGLLNIAQTPFVPAAQRKAPVEDFAGIEPTDTTKGTVTV